MNRNNIIVKFNDDELNIIRENVHSIYNKMLNSPFKQMFIRNVYKIIADIILTLGFFAIMITIGTLLVVAKVSETFYLIMFIVGIILFLISTLLVTVGQVFVKKIKQEFLKHNINYLKMAVNATFLRKLKLAILITNLQLSRKNF